MSKFDDALAVALVIRIRTKSLYIGRYADSQQKLFDRVVLLRERDKLTFAAIAKCFTEQGIRSTKGCLLSAEHVFSIYKKGKLRQQRLTDVQEPELISLGFLIRASRLNSA